jgi:hypothetical protein
MIPRNSTEILREVLSDEGMYGKNVGETGLIMISLKSEIYLMTVCGFPSKLYTSKN